MTDNEMEEWRQAVGFEGLYEVSSLGRVRSVDRTITRSNGRAGRIRGSIVTQKTLVEGYRRVCLMRNGKRCNRFVHRMIAEAFIPNPMGYRLVMHKRQPKTDCRVENLEWGTDERNQRQRVEDGTSPRGENNGNAILTDGQVFDIRVRRAAKESLAKLATEFDISKSLVSLISLGKAWSHVGGPIGKPHATRVNG